MQETDTDAQTYYTYALSKYTYALPNIFMLILSQEAISNFSVFVRYVGTWFFVSRKSVLEETKRT